MSKKIRKISKYGRLVRYTVHRYCNKRSCKLRGDRQGRFKQKCEQVIDYFMNEIQKLKTKDARRYNRKNKYGKFKV